MSGGVVFFIYLGFGLFLPFRGEEGSIYDSVKRRSSYHRGGATVEDVKSEFDNLKSRVTKMEDSVFNKERDWEERFNKG